jgi:hypothetical protein
MLTPKEGRNYDYQTLVMSFLENLMKSAFIIASFPEFLKPCATVSFCASFFLQLIPHYIYRIVARFVSHVPTHVRQTMEFIRPIVEERFAKMEEFGESWDEAPVRPILFEFVTLFIRRELRVTC